jgi:NAD-dependent dihydropyrimidine dehydrogenase PreA subunit
MVVVDKNECTGCGICTDVCPVGAASLVDGVSVIDPDKCVECLSCIDECPVEAIKEQ